MKIPLIIIAAALMSAFVAGRFYSYELITKTTINSDSAEVWKHLSDFKGYSQWNPFVTSVQGEAIQGLQLEVIITPPKGKPMTFKPKLLIVEKDRELRWIGHFVVPGLFDGEHFFELQAKEHGGIEFVQGEVFSGLLAWMVLPFIKEETEAGFMAMNAALKQISEGKLQRTSL